MLIIARPTYDPNSEIYTDQPIVLVLVWVSMELVNWSKVFADGLRDNQYNLLDYINDGHTSCWEGLAYCQINS